MVSGGLIGVIGGGAFLFGGIAGLPAEHQGTLRGVAVSLISPSIAPSNVACALWLEPLQSRPLVCLLSL